MKSSVDCRLRLDLSVSGCSIVVRYLDSWYVGKPQKVVLFVVNWCVYFVVIGSLVHDNSNSLFVGW